MQVFANKEKLGTLTKTGNTTVQLSPSVITLGAKQYSTGNLVCDLSTDLDTGSVQASESYYVYAVVVSGNIALRASTNNSSPVGFSNFKLVGGLFTDGSSQVDYIADIDSKGEVVELKTVLWQKKTMATNNTPSQLNFSNLKIGKTYRLSAQADFTINPSRSGDGLFFNHNGTDRLAIRESHQNASSERFTSGHSVVFVAEATTIICSQNLQGTMFAGGTFAILEELFGYEETAKFD